MIGEWIEERFAVRDDPLHGTYDIGIGVGIGVNRAGTACSPMSRQVALATAKLYRKGTVRNILLVSTNGIRGLSEVAAMKKVLIAEGIPGGHIFTDPTPLGQSNTRKNAEVAKAIMDAQGFKTVVLVAQQWHAKRVKKTFERYFGQKIPIRKAWSRYGDAHQLRLSNLWVFHLWDWIASRIFQLKGWM